MADDIDLLNGDRKLTEPDPHHDAHEQEHREQALQPLNPEATPPLIPEPSPAKQEPFAKIKPPEDQPPSEKRPRRKPLSFEIPEKRIPLDVELNPRARSKESIDEVEIEDESDEDQEEKPEKSKADEQYSTPKAKLLAILKDEKIPSKLFIMRLFFADNSNLKLPKGFKVLDDLLKQSEVKAKQRKKVLWMFFDKNPEDAGLTFEDRDEEDEKSGLLSSSLKSNDELIEYPVRNPDGSFVKDAKGVPITVKLTKAQLYWQMQEERSMAARKNNDGDSTFEKFMAMMMQQQDQNLKIVLSLMTDRIRRAEERANFDPKEYVKSQLEFAQILGLKKEDTKDEIDKIRAQGEVVSTLVEKGADTLASKLGPELRAGLKDGISVLKDVNEIETEKKKTSSENLVIPNIPKEAQESIFKRIEHAVKTGEAP